jgi:hypothetical protein
MPDAIRMSNSIAAADITDASILEDMGVPPWAELARCMREINAACSRRDPIALDAITTALSQYQNKVIAELANIIYDDCAEAAAEQHAEGQRHLQRARTA